MFFVHAGGRENLTQRMKVISPSLIQRVAVSALAFLPASAGAEILVNLSASALPDGPVTSWTNTGTVAGNFTASGTPQAGTVQSVKAVTFAGTVDFFTGPLAPDSVSGINPNRSVEVWIYNPTVEDEETIIGWGHRGGPDGTNMSFNYGSNASYGAAGHWGAGPDIGWFNAGGAPAAGAWHYLVYTYDGNGAEGQGTVRVYADGVLLNSQAVGNLDTHTGFPFVVGGQNTDGGTPAGFNATFSIARLRVDSSVLSPEAIAAKYAAEQAELFPVAFYSGYKVPGTGSLAFKVTDRAPGSVVDPATFSVTLDAVRAGWSVEGAMAGPGNGYITSPEVAMPAAGALNLSFTHRYSFEYGGTAWDGGAVMFSVNGGEFSQLVADAFTAGKYDRPVAGNNTLNGLDAFNGDSPGYGAGSQITSLAAITGLNAGDKVRIRFVGAWDEGARGTAANWEIGKVSLKAGAATLMDADFALGAGGFTADSDVPVPGSIWNYHPAGAPVPGTLSSVKTSGVTTFTLPFVWQPGTGYSFTLTGKDTAGGTLTFPIFLRTPALPVMPAKTWPASFPGPLGANGTWGVRTFLNNGFNNAENLEAVLEFLAAEATTPAESPETVVDTQESYLNFTDPEGAGAAGVIGSPKPFPGNALSTATNGGTARADDYVVTVAHGSIKVEAEDVYTFNLRSDDGYLFRITSPTGNTPQFFAIDGGSAVDAAAGNIVYFPVGTGDANTRAFIRLTPGTYNLEYVQWEGNGGYFYQVSSARGLFVNDSDTAAWAPVGLHTGQDAPVEYPSIVGDWKVESTAAGGLTQQSLAGAAASIDAAVAADAAAATSLWSVINFDDPQSSSSSTMAGNNPWPRNTAADDDNYAMRMTATLRIPVEGDYLFGYRGDDGSSLTIDGAPAFSALVQNTSGLSVIARGQPLTLTNSGSLGAVANAATVSADVGVAGALAGSTATALKNVAGQNVEAPWSAGLNPQNAFTVEAWLRPAVANAPGALTCALSSGRFGDPRSGWLIYQSDTGWNFRTYYQSGLATAVNIAVEAPPVVGQWYHVVATWNGSVGKIYVDGVASEDGLPSDPDNPYVAPSSGSFRFGGRADNAFLWSGDIDEVAVYPAALDEATVKAHSANGKNAGRSVPYETLVQAGNPLAYWRMNESDTVVRNAIATDAGTGDSATTGRIHLTPGDYTIRSVYFEGAGGSAYEIFGAREISNLPIPMQLLTKGGVPAFPVLNGLELVPYVAPVAVPVLSNFGTQAGGVLTLTFSSEAGATYTLQSSTDLQTWGAVSTNIQAQGTSTTVTGSSIPGTAYFYINPAVPRQYFRIKRN